ncbi:hypothetical protein ACOSP6_09735 [Tenacibaculum sp. MEBiC06402]|uniref:hypothetical protein n=1 Tax=unclassified Tenacibaculum TaxID=2635139 RepID=UPI003B9B1A61
MGKKIIYITLFLITIISCEKPTIYFGDQVSENYQMTLDTLKNYDNYFIGEFNGKLLVSTEMNNTVISVFNTLLDSVSVSNSFSYKINNSDSLQTPFIKVLKYEPINKLDSNNSYRYLDYSDFYSVFDYATLKYYTIGNFKNLESQVLINHVDYTQLVNNGGISYRSSYFNQIPDKSNNFYIESIEAIENPEKGVRITYSFNCILYSDSNEIIELKNARGRCTFRY